MTIMIRIMLICFLTVILLSCASAPKVEAPRGEPIVIAVLYFDNHSTSEEYEPLRTGLTDMFITELSKFPELKVVERTKLDLIMAELQLSEVGLIDQDTMQKVGKLLGAQALYYGGYTPWAGELRLDGRLVRVETTEVIESDKSIGQSEELFKLVEEVSQKILQGVHQEYPKLRADLYYSKGQDFVKEGNIAEALGMYQKALSIYPTHEKARKAIQELKNKI